MLFTVLKVNSILNLKSLNRLYTQVQKSQLISQKNVFNFIYLFKLKRYSNVKQKTEINKNNTHNSVCQNRKVIIVKNENRL